MKASHESPDVPPYDPWNEIIHVGEHAVTAADFSFVFKKGQGLKTTANAKQMAAKKKQKRQADRAGSLTLEQQMKHKTRGKTMPS